MGFFEEFNVWLTALLDDYIHQYTARLAAILEPSLVTLGTLYVLIWGFLHIAGRIEEPVLEGLKRIAILAMVTFLGLNGIEFEVSEPDAVVVMLAVAAGEIDEDGLTRWIRDNWPA